MAIPPSAEDFFQTSVESPRNITLGHISPLAPPEKSEPAKSGPSSFSSTLSSYQSVESDLMDTDMRTGFSHTAHAAAPTAQNGISPDHMSMSSQSYSGHDEKSHPLPFRPVEDKPSSDAKPSTPEPSVSNSTAADNSQPIVLTRDSLNALIATVMSQQSPTPKNHADDALLADAYCKSLQSKFENSLVDVFNGQNYINWRTRIFADATIIGATHVIDKREDICPGGLSSIDKAKWNVRNSLLHTIIFQSLSHVVRQTLGMLEGESAFLLWDQITHEFAVSTAEERLLLSRDLISLSLQNQDFYGYLRRFRQVIARHKELSSSIDDIYHDIFIIGLGSYQSIFMKSKLDEFFSSGQGNPQNLDLKFLVDQRSSRVTKTATTSSLSQSSKQKSNAMMVNIENPKATSKCNHCQSDRHSSQRCWIRYPGTAPEKWRNNHKARIDAF